jgi:eukaryotic-like serine/threonine-protein kinase
VLASQRGDTGRTVRQPRSGPAKRCRSAQAYLNLQQGSAVAEFRKSSTIVAWGCATCPLTHLGLARAYMAQRDAVSATAAYNDFLSLWKDADPDIPILKQAKAEYAKL